MRKKYKGRLFILTMALTLVLAGCSSVNRESDEAIKESSIGEARREKTEEVASQASDIDEEGRFQICDRAGWIRYCE